MTDRPENNLPPDENLAVFSCEEGPARQKRSLLYAGSLAFITAYLLWPLLVGILSYCKLLEPGMLMAAGPLVGAIVMGVMSYLIAGRSLKDVGRLLAVAAALVAGAVTLLNSMFMEYCNLHVETPGTVEVISYGGKWQVTIFCISALLAAPVFEEILFRKICFERFSELLNPVSAALLAALCFAVMHLSLVQLPGLMLLALLWQWLFRRSRNLSIPVLLHFFNNLLAAALLLMARYLEWNL